MPTSLDVSRRIDIAKMNYHYKKEEKEEESNSAPSNRYFRENDNIREIA
jgi:hypothetical protein